MFFLLIAFMFYLQTWDDVRLLKNDTLKKEELYFDFIEHMKQDSLNKVSLYYLPKKDPLKKKLRKMNIDRVDAKYGQKWLKNKSDSIVKFTRNGWGFGYIEEVLIDCNPGKNVKVKRAHYEKFNFKKLKEDVHYKKRKFVLPIS